MQYTDSANSSQTPNEAYTHEEGTYYDGVIYSGSIASLELKSGGVQTNAISVGLINTVIGHDSEVQISDL